jgi:hypothetical protein
MSLVAIAQILPISPATAEPLASAVGSKGPAVSRGSIIITIPFVEDMGVTSPSKKVRIETPKFAEVFRSFSVRSQLQKSPKLERRPLARETVTLSRRLAVGREERAHVRRQAREARHVQPDHVPRLVVLQTDVIL